MLFLVLLAVSVILKKAPVLPNGDQVFLFYFKVPVIQKLSLISLVNLIQDCV